MSRNLRNGYDVFISYSHADQDWTRGLAGRLADVDYNGRPLRPWIDEQFLDPGLLDDPSELTSALDRSRLFALVLSPESVASPWVKFELDYFLKHRRLDEIVPILKEPSKVPVTLGHNPPLDFTNPDNFGRPFDGFVERLCPPGEFAIADAELVVDEGCKAVLDDDEAPRKAVPTKARDAFLTTLMQFDIEDPAAEGLAIAAFERAATNLLQANSISHPMAYDLRMLLAECLAIAIRRNPRYRQVAQHYIDLEERRDSGRDRRSADQDPVLSFVVVRAYSKLAESAPTLVDLGALLRVAIELDSISQLNNKKQVVAMMLGRCTAKLRGADSGDLLIQGLREGGNAAKLAAIVAITLAEKRGVPVFYLTESKLLHESHTAQPSRASEAPSLKLLALLAGLDCHWDESVRSLAKRSERELQRGFGIFELPYSHSWSGLRNDPPPAYMFNEPFMGTVAKATINNMEDLALHIDSSHVVCLTEPRIVDALFDTSGGLLIQAQNLDSPRCRRLRGRRIPFAMLDNERMAALSDGDQVQIYADITRVVSKDGNGNMTKLP